MKGTDRLKRPEIQNLYAVFAKLENEDQVQALLLDLCTPKEIQDMSVRLHVASMLAQGESYQHIQEQTGVSATTVARVSRAMNYGAGGYDWVFSLQEDTRPSETH